MNNRTARIIGLILALIVIVAAIWFLESGKTRFSGDFGEEVVTTEPIGQDAADRVAGKERKYDRAREITTPDGFINTDPLTIADLVGKQIILLDFWTYSCINCQRTLPYLNSWYEKYADDGLVIIGLHTPEFDFEKDYDNVKRAVEKYGIKYPVVLDNDYSTWRAYENSYWPRKYLIDIDGFVVYDHIGEGSYDETEREIVRLLNERSEVLGKEEVEMRQGEVDAPEVDFRRVATPETYLGYARMRGLANPANIGCYGMTCAYETPDELDLNRFAFGGDWTIGAEETELVSDTGSLTLRFKASKANLVAGGTDGPVRARILLDGEPISSDQAGYDVVDGFVEFDAHDLYNLVDLRGDYEEHLLEIRFMEPGVQVFAFTFG